MRVEVNRNAHFLSQRLHQFLRSVWFAQTGHIFDSQNVGTHPLQFLSHFDVVIQPVFIPFRIQNIAGIAHRCFAQLAGFANCIHRCLHVGQPV